MCLKLFILASHCYITEILLELQFLPRSLITPFRLLERSSGDDLEVGDNPENHVGATGDVQDVLEVEDPPENLVDATEAVQGEADKVQRDVPMQERFSSRLLHGKEEKDQRNICT